MIAPRRPFRLVPLLILLAAPAARAADPSGGFKTGPLSFEARVRAQAALERVYYNHRIWPKENPGPKPPFETMVPEALIRERAADALKMSEALRRFWNIEITPAMLQGEMERMERGSKDRATLHELFAALGNDPGLIAETLARGKLAGELLRGRYAYDAAIHAEAKARAGAVAARAREGADWSGLDGDHSVMKFSREEEGTSARSNERASGESGTIALDGDEFDTLRRRLARSESAGLLEDETGWRLERRVPGDGRELKVESLRIPKRDFGAWWAEAAPSLTEERAEIAIPRGVYRLPDPLAVAAGGCDTWDDPSKIAGVPEGRYYHTAVWTGSEMIVWGGQTLTGYGTTGGRYNPATDSWRLIFPGPNSPPAGTGLTAVWTGSEMIVWGGYNGAYLNAGGRYNPAGDTWTSTSTGTNSPLARRDHSAVWTGSEMIVWGGNNGAYLNTGGRYSPSGNSWTTTSTGTNVPEARDGHVAVWTGGAMIVWGGGSNLNTGGRYNPIGDSWLPTSMGANVPAGRVRMSAVWTGSEMIIWGGFNGLYLNSGGRYDPAGDSWLPTLVGANTPSFRWAHTAVWTGTEMIVWGGNNSAGTQDSGSRYNPATNSWQYVFADPSIPSRSNHAAIWSGSEMIVWGGYNGTLPIVGGRYNPTFGSWVPTATGAPAARYAHTAVWTGAEMIVWGGRNVAGPLASGGRYVPATASWQPVSTGANAPGVRTGHSAIWTGSAMIVWGGAWSGDYNTGGRYNPVSNSWLSTSVGTNVPDGRYQHSALWTGSEMIVWGGYNSVFSYLNTGGRYNPVTDAWLPTSIGANVPAVRSSHTAVWTGNSMIVWGGYNGAYLNSGGRYDPVGDAWMPTSLGANVPGIRTAHAAAWTGGVMIVWGGSNGTSLNSGGRYDPISDSWLPTSLGANVPVARGGHTAVWTGGEMIVWGGSATGYMNSGGRYNPASDAWLSTSIGANVPSVRGSHTAVWTGSPLNSMIVWGGSDGGALNTGGLYSLSGPPSPANSLRGGKSGTLNLSWAASSGATSYNVKRCAGACLPATIAATPASNAYSEPLDPATCFYAVEAVNACGATP